MFLLTVGADLWILYYQPDQIAEGLLHVRWTKWKFKSLAQLIVSNRNVFNSVASHEVK